MEDRLIREPIVLEGNHVRIVPMEESHAPGLLRAGDHPEIWTYLPERFIDLKQTEAWVTAALRARDMGTEFPFVITNKETGEVLGSTRFLDILPAHRNLEIGWTWLTPGAWRTSVNTECKYLLLRHCFEELGLIRVTLKTDARNERSQRAIERIGGVKEGVLRHHRIMPDGYLRDSVYYGILREEWPLVRERLKAKLEER